MPRRSRQQQKGKSPTGGRLDGNQIADLLNAQGKALRPFGMALVERFRWITELGRRGVLFRAYSSLEEVAAVPRTVDDCRFDFMSEEFVKEFDYEAALDYVESYDPSQQVVIVLSFVLGPYSRDRDNSIMFAFVIGRGTMPQRPGVSAAPRAVDNNSECRHCGAPTRKLCGGCRMTAYCSPEHIRADWPRHRKDCRAFGEMLARHDVEPVSPASAPLAPLAPQGGGDPT